MAANQLAVAPDVAPKAVPINSMLFLLNSFIGNTTSFLNEFAHTAERKLTKTSSDISRLEKSLILLEAKLARIPGLTDLPEAEVSGKLHCIAPLVSRSCFHSPSALMQLLHQQPLHLLPLPQIALQTRVKHRLQARVPQVQCSSQPQRLQMPRHRHLSPQLNIKNTKNCLTWVCQPSRWP